MKIILFFLYATLLLSCTANAQTGLAEPKRAASITAAPFCETTPKTASNVKMSNTSYIAQFEGHLVITSAITNCAAIYEQDTLLYFGDYNAFFFSPTMYVVQIVPTDSDGPELTVVTNLVNGTGSFSVNGGYPVFLNPATYNGRCSRNDWSIVKRAN